MTSRSNSSPDSFANDPDRLTRFAREAQVLASLNHPNIAAIYGVEERAIVMELVEGPDMAGPLEEEHALPIINQLIDALEYAHEKGIVHRHLKPANLKFSWHWPVTAGTAVCLVALLLLKSDRPPNGIHRGR